MIIDAAPLLDLPNAVPSPYQNDLLSLERSAPNDILSFNELRNLILK